MTLDQPSPGQASPDQPAPGTRAAFEITKGPRPLRFLSEADVAAALAPEDLLDELEQGFGALERGEIQQPARVDVNIPTRGFSLSMPAWRSGGPIGVKEVNVFDGNLAVGLPNHLALISLFDADTGMALAVMDGTYITGVRTAASAVVSARLLARADASVATIVGAGVQAREHLRLLPLVRDFERINICSLRPDEAERLAATSPYATALADLERAVIESDVVCLATHSPTPVIDAGWLRPGCHVTSVGYHPPDGELPRTVLDRGRLFVESDDAFEPPPVGCAELRPTDATRGTRLGEVVLDPSSGRRDPAEITIYKAMGLAFEDVVAADLALRTAAAKGIGTMLEW